jgi:3-deoxy-manno-octulosonate cytidylyltransferase (CMP-KDO synthetase)
VMGSDAGIVINIQGDEPLVDPGLIDRLADVMIAEPEWDMGTAATPIESENELALPSVVKVVWDQRGQALYFSRSMIPFVRDQKPAGLRHWRHVGLYAYRRLFLDRLVKTAPCALELAEKLEQLRALYLGGRIKVIESRDSGVAVDTPGDVPRAEMAIRQAGLAM